MKVLIVDDTVFMRMTIRRILEAHGFVVVAEATDGVDAVMKYKTNRPDLVIMDISMPRMDGIEAVKQIINYDANATIIMCSLQGQKSNVMEAIKAGAKSYLVKPVKEDKLIRELQKLQLNLATRQFVASKISGDSKEEPDAPEPCATDTVDADSNVCDDVIKRDEARTQEFIKGLEQGYLESKREIATNMIRVGIALDVIMGCVELSEEEVKSYKKEYGL